VQEHIGIFPSEFNYNKKLLLVSAVILLGFYKNKGIKKKYLIFFFLSKGRHFCTITQPLVNLLVSEYI
jgi:hypothetical protein